jgi:hypothetical protein
VGEGLVGHLDPEELAQRPPPLPHLVDQEPLGRHPLPHLPDVALEASIARPRSLK